MAVLVKRILYVLLAVAIISYVFLFHLANQETTDIDFLFVIFHGVSVDLLVIGGFVVGGMLGVASGLMWVMLLYRRIARFNTVDKR